MTDALETVQAEPFWDRSAPYVGPHDYTRGTGEFVTGKITRAIQFKMRPGDQCIARGVMEMSDGLVYLWAVRAEGHADGEHRRLAGRVRSGTFEQNARELFEFEKSRIEPDLLDHYRAQCDAL